MKPLSENTTFFKNPGFCVNTMLVGKEMERFTYPVINGLLEPEG
jgi:hypothetical protein